MKKILVVDWLDKFGGAERVIAHLQHIFHFDQTYTLVNVMDQDELQKINPNQTPIHTSKLQLAGKHFRKLFVFFPFFISKFKVSPESRLIFSSSHSVAKGIKKSSPKQIHISYFQARNCNYIWSETNLYFGKYRFLLYPVIKYLRYIDVKQAQRPDYIICNSKFVQNWVKKTYNRDSIVIYPPIDLSKFQLETSKSDYYVSVGRIAHIKRFDILIDAFKENGKKLILIGDGELYKHFKKNLPKNIEMPGFLDSTQVSKIISRAKAFVQVGIEGFGIAPIEAQACGTPIIAYKEGGVLETVIENESGILFDEQTSQSLNHAINLFESKTFDYHKIRQNALRFSEERFKNEITSFIKDKVNLS